MAEITQRTFVELCSKDVDSRASCPERMPMRLLYALILLLAVALPIAAQAETYTWTRPDGSLGVTNDLGEVPEQYREQAAKNTEKAKGGVSQGNYQKEYPEEGQDTAKDAAKVITKGTGSTAKSMTDEEQKKINQEIKEVYENLKKVIGEELKK